MKVVVQGFGSIGRRHAANLSKAGHEVVLLRHNIGRGHSAGFRHYESLDEILKEEGRVDGIVICTPTSFHLSAVLGAVSRDIPFLLEKPPALNLAETQTLAGQLRERAFTKYAIGFNLRYFPLMQFIKGFIKNLGEVYAAAVIAGSYLPEWRRGDYRQVSSARRSMGGGVLLDLVHEIDYLLWFFGMPLRVLGYLNTVGKLDIDTEDLCVALLKYRNGSIITLNLNYLSKKRLRDGLVIGEHGTLTWEYVTGQVIYHSSTEASQVVYTIPAGYDLNETYVAEVNQFLSEALCGGVGPVTIEQAMDIMRVVDVIRQSASEERWVDV